MEAKIVCMGCGRTLGPDEKPSRGVNYGNGPYYWCATCSPPIEDPEEMVREIIQFFKDCGEYKS